MLYRIIATTLWALMGLCCLGYTVAHWAEMGSIGRAICVLLISGLTLMSKLSYEEDRDL